jgi:hypothetical protein
MHDALARRSINRVTGDAFNMSITNLNEYRESIGLVPFHYTKSVEPTPKSEPKPKREVFKLAGMTYQPRLNRYKAANVIYDCNTEIATSYDWWQFTRRIGGFLIFNDYNYSNSTRNHQNKVRRLLWNLNHTIHYTIEAPKGLQRLDLALAHYEIKIKSLKDEIATPRSHKRKNLERLNQIKAHEGIITIIRNLIELDKKAAV